jgi:hypothetical protein
VYLDTGVFQQPANVMNGFIGFETQLFSAKLGSLYNAAPRTPFPYFLEAEWNTLV